MVPGLAKREHEKNLPLLFRNYTLKDDRLYKRGVDMVAVTVGPGLEPCLWTGINFAKEIRRRHFPKAKLIGANHLHGHLYSFLLSYEIRPRKLFTRPDLVKLFPAVSLVVSGGHTILLLMESLTKWKKLGETLDDAAGEAFDKVARMLGLPYPGGPEIEKLAQKGNPNAINFPRPMIHHKNYDFSFSGLKTAVLYYLKGNLLRSDLHMEVGSPYTENIAASFQQAAIDVLIAKTLRAAEEYRAKSIMLSGGVAANKTLRKAFQKSIRKSLTSDIRLLTSAYNTDNAVMIAAAAYINHLRKKNHRLFAQPNLSL